MRPDRGARSREGDRRAGPRSTGALLAAQLNLRRLALPAAALLLILVAALASGVFDGILPRAERPLCEVGGTVSECGSATGVVLSVDGPRLAEVNGFSLRTPAGQVFDFEIERLELVGGGKPAPHLREHQLDGLPITVDYKVDGGRLVALRYRDAE